MFVGLHCVRWMALHRERLLVFIDEGDLPAWAKSLAAQLNDLSRNNRPGVFQNERQAMRCNHGGNATRIGVRRQRRCGTPLQAGRNPGKADGCDDQVRERHEK